MDCTNTTCEDDSSASNRCRVPVRFLVAGLLLFGACTSGMTRANVAMTIIAMAPQASNQSDVLAEGHLGNQSTVNPYCGHWDGIDPSQSGDEPMRPYEFNWPQNTQDNIRGAFFVGFAVALIPSGRLCEFYSGKTVAIISGILQTVLNLATPFTARHSVMLLIACRVILGIACAMIIPAFFGIISRWVLEDEKSKAIACLSVGNSLGSIILNLVSGYLCQRLHWDFVFYLTSALSFVWLLLWYLVASNHPSKHHFISADELMLLTQESSEDNTERRTPVTWRLYWRMLTSVPVLSLLYVKLVHAWFFNLLQSKLPQQMVSVLGMNLEQTGIWNTLFHVTLFISCLSSGCLADFVIKRSKFSRTNIRKSFEAVSTFGGFLFLALVATSNCNRTWFILSMTLATGCSGVSTGGSSTVVVDLTTDYSASLISILAILVYLIGYLTPHMVTLLLDKVQSDSNLMNAWNCVFNVSAIIMASGGVVFLYFGSADNQNWEVEAFDAQCNEALSTSEHIEEDNCQNGQEFHAIPITVKQPEQDKRKIVALPVPQKQTEPVLPKQSTI